MAGSGIRGMHRFGVASGIAIATAAACGEAQDEVATARHGDSGAPRAMGDDRAGDAGVSVNELIAQRCEERGALAIGTLEMVPAHVTAFSHWSAPCDALGTGLLIRNTSDDPVEVEAVDAAPAGFSASGVELPRVLAAGETLRVSLKYARTDDVGNSRPGKLTVMASEGCTDFDVRGLATDEGLHTYDRQAIDFGTVAAGTTSSVEEVRVRYQKSPEFYQSEFEGFAAYPSEQFELVSAPAGALQPKSCETFTVGVRFAAPEEVGLFEGGLLWRVSTDSPLGLAEATVFVPLYARVE